MAKIDMALIQQLRERTGLGMMDCKKALEETSGDVEKAIEVLRKKGAAVALKRSDKMTAEGIVHAYIHPGAQVGVLLEINCETDFVARTDAVKELANDVCLHIAAMKPLYLTSAQVDTAFLDKEKEILKEQLIQAGKPTTMVDQILQGKLKKLYTEICLMDQPFIKNDKQTIQDYVQQVIAKTGENVKITRFARFEIGA